MIKKNVNTLLKILNTNVIKEILTDIKQHLQRI